MDLDAYIQKLTIEEKAALLQGLTTWTTHPIPRLGIPSIFLADGPHGLRKQAGSADHLGLNESIPATCFPTAATMANTWDVELGEALGQALGAEAAANDVHVVLGPGLNIKRSPLCGRNFEYFSEDPYLAGKMAAAYIRGIQKNGVAACPKHFAANSQELRRMSTDSVVDERTLRELYLTGFEIAVKEGKARSIMSSYNLINGTYANENPHLLRDILREQWGFDGFVVTDWGADNDHTEGVRAGSALVMPAPGYGCAQKLVEDVQAGILPENALDDRLRELLAVVFETHGAVAQQPKTVDTDVHHALAKQCAAEAIVLLENDGILPLRPDTKVALIGDFGKMPRYQGAGSSKVNPTKLENLLQCAQSQMTVTAYAQGFCQTSSQPDSTLEAEAVAAARAAEVAVLCIGLDESSEAEGMDRTHLLLPENQRSLVAAVAAANPNVVLVLSGGSPFLMPQKGSYRAAIHGYLGGQAGAAAMVDALLGKQNPCGKLSETWPERLEDCPSYPYFPSKDRIAQYREGLYVGYRYYDTAEVPVRYPFGHGLSYTSFTYSDLTADKNGATFTVTNTGSRAGAEVAQLYICCRNGAVFRPKKELKGFAKVFLNPGQSQTVTIPLDDKAFRYFHPSTGHFEVETANYEVLICASVSDCRLRTTLRIFGTDAPAPYGALPCYERGQITDVPDEAFEALLGRPIPDGSWSPVLQPNAPLCRLADAKSPAGRWLHRLLKGKMDKSGADVNLLFVYNMPLRGVAKMVGKHISQDMVEDLVFAFNGHLFRGGGRFLRGFFRNKAVCRRFRKKLEQPLD